jgi:hypothetical protein
MQDRSPAAARRLVARPRQEKLVRSLNAVAAGEFVVDQASFRSRCLARHAHRDTLATDPICAVHEITLGCASESAGSLCHRALAVDAGDDPDMGMVADNSQPYPVYGAGWCRI